MILSRSASNLVEFAFLIGTALALVAWIWLAVSAAGAQKNRLWPRLSGVAGIFLLWAVALAWVRIHTGAGVLALGGANHWVKAASHEESEKGAVRILREIVESSTYGAEAADRAVLRRSDEEQARLFRLLEEATSSENWREKFRMRAAAARARIGPPPAA